MSTCTKCLKKEATLRCKMCHRPICEDCGISAPGGIFCSEECGKKMESHIERIKEIDEERPIIKQKRIPTIVKLIIWLVVLSVYRAFYIEDRYYREYKGIDWFFRFKDIEDKIKKYLWKRNLLRG